MKHRYTFMAMIMVDANHDDEVSLTNLLTDDPLTNYIAEAIDVAMEMNEIEGTVYHVHVSSDPHSEEIE